MGKNGLELRNKKSADASSSVDGNVARRERFLHSRRSQLPHGADILEALSSFDREQQELFPKA
jgi:hypothetical protein